MIAGLVFLDPINFLLYLPDVAYNFLYRVPTRANEWMLYAFVAREMGIAWSLWRRFFWFEGIVWKDEVDYTASAMHLRGISIHTYILKLLISNICG